MDFLWGAAALIFIKILDTVAYKILAGMYQIFLAVSRINIFATEGGMKIFSDVSTQLYTVIGIAMIFVFAYQLVLLIINPEGGNQKAPSKLFMDTVISMVVVLMLPTIFNYMTVFQDHVLTNGTIPALILGTNAAEDLDEDAGYNIALMVMVSFYHPNNSDYTTFHNEDGSLKDGTEGVDACKAAGDDETTCTNFNDALKEFHNDKTITSFTWSSKLSQAIYKEETMSYMWVLSTAGALLVSWFLVTYSIDIGTRAVKLGFLQIIAPVPVILRIFPQSRKTFETWFGEIKKTYLELFIRLAVIFFTVRLIQIVPTLITAVFDSTSGSGDGIVIKCIATVLLILGLLKFAQEAPELVKTMFNSGGNLLAGMNLKPGVRKHIEDNKFGMAGIGAAAGLVGGMIGGGANAVRTAKQRNGGNGRFGSNAGAAIYGGLRGAMTGAVHGAKNAPKDLSRKGFGEGMEASIRASQDSYNKGTWAEKIIRAGQNADDKTMRGRWKAMAGETGSMISDVIKKEDKWRKNTGEMLQGVTMDKDQKAQLFGNLGAIMGSMISTPENSPEIAKLKKDQAERLAQMKEVNTSEIAKMSEWHLKDVEARKKAAGAAALATFDKDNNVASFQTTFTSTQDPRLASLKDEVKNAIVQQLAQGQPVTTSISTGSVTDTSAFKTEIEAAQKFKGELDAVKAANARSIAELQAEQSGKIAQLKAEQAEALQKATTTAFAGSKVLQDAMHGSMAELHKMMEANGHQMGEAKTAINNVITTFNEKYEKGHPGESSPFANITTVDQLFDVYSKNDQAIPGEITSLLTEIKDQVTLQSTMAAKAEAQKKLEDKK